MRLENPFQVQNLGNGRVKFSLTINFKLIVKLLLILLATCIVGALLVGLGLALYHLAMLLWDIKWWLLGALGVGFIVYLLTKVNWKKIKLTEKHLKWLLVSILIILIALFTITSLRSCERYEETTETEPVETETITITEETFKDPGDWIMLDCYLSKKLNVVYVNYKKFEHYNEDLTYVERCEVFDEEQFFTDWSPVFAAFEGHTFSVNELAALKRYALWCGPNGFPYSPVYQKLVNDEEILATDLAVVYTSTGEIRKYESKFNKEYARKYAWVLMAVYDGFITVDELMNARVKTFKDLDVDAMYDRDKPFFSDDLKEFVLQYDNGEPTTREVLGL